MGHHPSPTRHFLVTSKFNMFNVSYTAFSLLTCEKMGGKYHNGEQFKTMHTWGQKINLISPRIRNLSMTQCAHVKIWKKFQIKREATVRLLHLTIFIHLIKWNPIDARASFRCRIPASKVASSSVRRDDTCSPIQIEVSTILLEWKSNKRVESLELCYINWCI